MLTAVLVLLCLDLVLTASAYGHVAALRHAAQVRRERELREARDERLHQTQVGQRAADAQRTRRI